MCVVAAAAAVAVAVAAVAGDIEAATDAALIHHHQRYDVVSDMEVQN